VAFQPYFGTIDICGAQPRKPSLIFVRGGRSERINQIVESAMVSPNDEIVKARFQERVRLRGDRFAIEKIEQPNCTELGVLL
jgi:hypothetical protein